MRLWGMGHGVWGMGYGVWGMGYGKRGTIHLLALPALVIELIRRDVDPLVRVAMVGVLHANDLWYALRKRRAEGEVRAR